MIYGQKLRKYSQQYLEESLERASNDEMRALIQDTEAIVDETIAKAFVHTCKFSLQVACLDFNLSSH